MREQPGKIILGARILRRALGAERVVIAVEDQMETALKPLSDCKEFSESRNISLVRVPTIYPEGGERQLIHVLTGLEVPAGGRPSDLGLVCQNVATAAAVAEAITAGKPLIERYIAVTGNGITHPRNFLALFGTDRCEIWTGTQFPTADQGAAAAILGLKPEQVKIHTMFLGGGFGRRAAPTSDFVSEAVHVAKASGAPVKVVWTREDDMRGGYYRPMFLHRLRVGLDADGLPVAWQQTLVGQSILEGTPFAAMMEGGIDPTSVEGTADSPYVKGTPHHRVELHSPKNAIPVLWLRSVGHTHTAFVMETFVDELARAAGQDPLEYRRRLLKDHPRHLGVLNLLHFWLQESGLNTLQCNHTPVE